MGTFVKFKNHIGVDLPSVVTPSLLVVYNPNPNQFIDKTGFWYRVSNEGFNPKTIVDHSYPEYAIDERAEWESQHIHIAPDGRCFHIRSLKMKGEVHPALTTVELDFSQESSFACHSNSDITALQLRSMHRLLSAVDTKEEFVEGLDKNVTINTRTFVWFDMDDILKTIQTDEKKSL